MSKNQPKRRTIIWERTKRPLIFVGVCLAAAFALKYLYEYRSSYLEAKNAPFVIFDKNEVGSEQNTLKAISSQKLIEVIGKNLQKSETIKKDDISSIVTNIKSTAFKDLDEFITTLNGEFNELRTKKIAEAMSEISEVKEKEKSFPDVKASNKELLADKTKLTKDDSSVNIKQIITEIKKSATQPATKSTSDQTEKATVSNEYLVEALNDISKKPDSSNLLKRDLFNVLEIYFTKKEEMLKRDLAKAESNRTSIENDFDSIKTNIFGIKKEIGNILISKVETYKDQSRETLENQKSQLSYLFLDENGGFNPLFKLIELTLMVILVFGLLYIILIPLKYLFFLSTSADVLGEKAKEYLKRENAAVGLTDVGKALILTAGTVTLGTMAIINSEANPLSAKKDSPELPVVAPISPNPPPNNAENPFKDSQLIVDRLTREIKELNGTVDKLKKEIDEFKIPDGLDYTQQFEAVNSNLANLNKAVGTEELLKDGKDNLPNRINGMSGKIAEAKLKEFQGYIDPIKDKIATAEEFKNKQSLQGRIGEVESLLKNPKPENPIFAKITDISDVLGTEEFKRLPASSKSSLNSRKTVFQTMTEMKSVIGDRGDSKYSLSGNGKNTLFGNINNVFEAISPEGYLSSKSSIFATLGAHSLPVNDNVYSFTRFASRNTQDIGNIGRLMVKDSGNIETFFARLFEGKQYSFNPFLINEFEKMIFDLERKLAENPNPQNDKEINENIEIKKSVAELRLLTKILKEITKEKNIMSKKYSGKEICQILIPKMVLEPKKEKEQKDAENIFEKYKETIFYFSHVDSY